MKRTLAIASLALAFTCAAAHAGSTRLPTEMLGPWCPVPAEQQTGHGSTTYARSTDEQVNQDPECLHVTQTEMYGMEDGCKFTRKDKKVDYIVYMQCWAAGDDEGPVPIKRPVQASIFAMFEGQLKMWPVGCPKC